MLRKNLFFLSILKRKTLLLIDIIFLPIVNNPSRRDINNSSVYLVFNAYIYIEKKQKLVVNLRNNVYMLFPFSLYPILTFYW